ncbi:hypothetical protein GCM10010390_89660 [Streptomyces mordarskii]|uniref:Uncharacterized protein n=1 Tax=Streptomyces mordarskii TaxID=1226758 RepID=A0ABN1ERM2_9ACTN
MVPFSSTSLLPEARSFGGAAAFGRSGSVAFDVFDGIDGIDRFDGASAGATDAVVVADALAAEAVAPVGTRAVPTTDKTAAATKA